MKYTILFLVSFPLFAQEFFQVGKSGNVFRGREPRGQVEKLARENFTDVVIFKNEVRSEVTRELEDLEKFRITSHYIPFRWKEFQSVKEACEQVAHGLKILEKVQRENRKVFFHCTAGEDRTGVLAGLFLMLTERQSMRKVFEKELCPNGYAEGNPAKPRPVTSAIHKELTPLFVALAEKIQKGEWKRGKIHKSVCRNLALPTTSLRCSK
jgi:protein-tyrosine phosphatase